MTHNNYCEEFIKPSGIHESLFVGYLWQNPKLYKKYKNNELEQYNPSTNEGTFTLKVWYFYYKLGIAMFNNGIQNFNDTTVYSFVASQPDIGDFSWIKKYNSYGGYKQIYTIMQECQDEKTNETYHYSEIQKYELLRYYENVGVLNPEKIIRKKKVEVKLKDFLTDMKLEQLKSYFSYHVKKGGQSVGGGHLKITNLFDGIDDSISKFNKGEQMGIPLFESPRLTQAIKGWQIGNFIMLVMSSGVGKSSFAYSKFALGIIESDEKCFFGVNEENKNRAHHTLISTVSASVTKSPISRERLSQGHFTKEEMESINKAKDWLNEHPSDKIKFAEIEKFYVDEFLESVELHRSLGYRYAMLDTMKSDSSSSESARWEKFSQHAQDIFDCIKPSANNIGMLATLQLKIGMDTRYLDLECIGKSREVVETADIVLMGRMLFEDEYDGKKLKVYDYVEGETGWHRKEIILDEDKEYMILFIPKNRNGSKTQQILYEVDYDVNSWKEIGYCNLKKSAR